MKLSQNDLVWYGRNFTKDNVTYFDYSASGFEFCFTGTKAQMTILSDSANWNEENKGVLGIYVSKINPSDYKGNSLWNDFPEDVTKKIFLNEYENKILLFESEKQETVLIRVLKLSECAFGYAGLADLQIDGELIKPTQREDDALKIEFIGDSITCGYGIEGVWNVDTFSTKTERADKAYAFLTAKNLNAKFHLVSWSGIGIISNYVDESVNVPFIDWLMPSNWPYTDKSAQLRLGMEIEIWDETKFSPDIVVINLGTNDASFVRDKEERRLSFVSSYKQLLEAVHRRSPNAKICCCLGLMGQLLNNSVKEAIERFNKEFPNVKTKMVDFPVQDEKDGIAADWHPSAITHKKAAEQLAKELKSF